MTKTGVPRYDELPIDPKYPPHTAWGVWGLHDNLGTLNFLTAERIAQATKFVRRGAVFSLNWGLEQPNPPFFGRSAIQHQIRDRSNDGRKFDDVYDNFNTQSSTQWDGLRHVCHLSSHRFYNNVAPSEVTPGPEATDRLGMHFVARHGIAGRAVLLDYARWAEKHCKQEFKPLSRQEVTVEELEMVAAEQKVKFMPGDILLIRMGWMAAHLKTPEVMAGAKIPQCIGLKACQKTFKWLWDHQFAAVASDVIALEAFPPHNWDDSLHAQCLGGFGMMLGEMFYLEDLAEDSAHDGVYEYLFTSTPLNKEGGVASPPNALCLK